MLKLGQLFEHVEGAQREVKPVHQIPIAEQVPREAVALRYKFDTLAPGGSQ